jgi:soluble lytic murein transglycosylase
MMIEVKFAMKHTLLRLGCILLLAGAAPAAALAEAAPTLDRVTTGSIIKAASPTAAASAIDRAFDALNKGDVASARAIRDGLKRGSLAHKTLSWALAYHGGGKLPSDDIADAAVIAADWPGAKLLRANSERALARENHGPADIIAAFGGTEPQTFEGALALARAFKAKGDMKAAVEALSGLWKSEKLEGEAEAAVIGEFGKAMPASVHRVRMQAMLYDERVTSAGRVATLAGATALHKAWAAVIRKQSDAGRLLEAVPEKQRIAGWHFANIRHLRRNERTTLAANAMLAAPRDADKLIDTREWWNERQILARDLIDLKKYDLAYKVAAGHSATTPSRIADAEFHAGWIALRFIGDAATARRHFEKLAEVTDGPISKSRAHYWLGRAAEAGSGGDASAHFAKAAGFATTYYGQLAAARIGRKALSVAYPEPGSADRERFDGRELVRAARLLIDAGHASRANPLLDTLGDELQSPGELALLAVMAERAGQAKMALQIGKAAAHRGVDVGALTHPLGAIPKNAKLSDAGRALAYAIARQESEFHIAARSGAGALGLLQLLPGTAKEVAGRAGLPWSKNRLTTDAGYNAALGSRYLSEQIDRFDGSYILTFIAYNAGPRRADEWVVRYGNPKGMAIDDVVDWVELIPFSETRSYVQRVMENYQVYKWRLNGRYDIVRDLRYGRD